MSGFRNFIRDYLNFTNSQKRGVYILIFLIVLVTLLPEFISYHSPHAAAFERLVRDSAGFCTTSDVLKSNIQDKPAAKLFYFDPNTVEPDKLKTFGLSRSVIERFKKYRNAGARFYKSEDILRIYGIKQEWYDAMKPWMVFNTNSKVKSSYDSSRSGSSKNTANNDQKAPLELNAADSIHLVNINGVGPYLAHKIIRYRELLGGFYKLDQLYEIYGMNQDQVDRIIGRFTLDTTRIVKLNINQLDYYQLRKHPYLTSREASLIVKYRKQHGPYTNSDDLSNLVLLDQESIRKLNPYLTY